VGPAHYSVLQSVEAMQPYIDEHLDIIREESNGRIEEWVMKQHKHRLTTWLREQDIPDGETKDDINRQRLVVGLSSQVTSWESNGINGYKYYTNAKDNKCVILWHH
jgi:hypothetical protein